MARIELAPEVGEDFDRIIDHLTLHAGGDFSARIRDIIEAIDILQDSPMTLLRGDALAIDRDHAPLLEFEG